MAGDTLDPAERSTDAVCDHLVTVSHSGGVIGPVRNADHKPPDPAAEWLVESA